MGLWLSLNFLGHGLVVGGTGFCHCAPLFLYSAANTEGLWYRRGVDPGVRTQTQSSLASSFGGCREAAEALGLPRRANPGLCSPRLPGWALLKPLSSPEGI